MKVFHYINWTETLIEREVPMVRRVAKNFSWGLGFDVEQLLPLKISSTPKNLLPSYILVHHITVFRV